MILLSVILSFSSFASFTDLPILLSNFCQWLFFHDVPKSFFTTSEKEIGVENFHFLFVRNIRTCVHVMKIFLNHFAESTKISCEITDQRVIAKRSLSSNLSLWIEYDR